jgi:hypothetical protein
MLDQVKQQIEDLRLDSSNCATAIQFTAARVELTIAKAIPQGPYSFG